MKYDIIKSNNSFNHCGFPEMLCSNILICSSQRYGTVSVACGQYLPTKMSYAVDAIRYIDHIDARC